MGFFDKAGSIGKRLLTGGGGADNIINKAILGGGIGAAVGGVNGLANGEGLGRGALRGAMGGAAIGGGIGAFKNFRGGRKVSQYGSPIGPTPPPVGAQTARTMTADTGTAKTMINKADNAVKTTKISHDETQRRLEQAFGVSKGGRKVKKTYRSGTTYYGN